MVTEPSSSRSLQIISVEKIASIDRGWLLRSRERVMSALSVEKIASIDRGWLPKTNKPNNKTPAVEKIASIDRGWLLAAMADVAAMARSGENSLD